MCPNEQVQSTESLLVAPQEDPQEGHMSTDNVAAAESETEKLERQSDTPQNTETSESTKMATPETLKKSPLTPSVSPTTPQTRSILPSTLSTPALTISTETRGYNSTWNISPRVGSTSSSPSLPSHAASSPSISPAFYSSDSLIAPPSSPMTPTTPTTPSSPPHLHTEPSRHKIIDSSIFGSARGGDWMADMESALNFGDNEKFILETKSIQTKPSMFTLSTGGTTVVPPEKSKHDWSGTLFPGENLLNPELHSGYMKTGRKGHKIKVNIIRLTSLRLLLKFVCISYFAF